jgi:hypothetical protein
MPRRALEMLPYFSIAKETHDTAPLQQHFRLIPQLNHQSREMMVVYLERAFEARSSKHGASQME